MQACSLFSTRLDISGLCLIAALAAACSSNPIHPVDSARSAPDGAGGLLPEAGAAGSGGTSVNPPDAPIATDGSGGISSNPPDAPVATGGSGGTSSNPPDAPTATGGSGGATGTGGGPGGTGGAAGSGGMVYSGGVAAGGNSGGAASIAGGGGGNGGSGGIGGCGIFCIGSSGGAGGSTRVKFNPRNCGNGVLDSGEGCDDGNSNDGDGCNRLCQLDANWLCPIPGQPCIDLRACGNGVLTSDETCDDGNTQDGDGCSADCKTIEDGWRCRVPGKRCVPLCGDGKITGSETCDDGNSSSGDGCSNTCLLEPGSSCPTPGQACTNPVCGNGIKETGEPCDCGLDPTRLPAGCEGPNGLFYGDGKGCSQTCTKEPNCRDSFGHNQACTTACGDGNLDQGEECDDGNQVSGDGCSSTCTQETGFSCATKSRSTSSPCQSGTGECLEMSITYRDFQPENVSPGGHPDFYWLGYKWNGSAAPTTICVPNSGGPARGNDSTARCWDIADSNLSNGKPIYNSSRANNLCACQFSDWNIGDSARIPGGYTAAANDSPLSDGAGGFRGGGASSLVTLTNESGSASGTVFVVTAGSLGAPSFRGVVPIVKDANSFKQWFTDDSSVNKTFRSILEMRAIGTNLYQYASRTHLAGPNNGFYPLDNLNPSQATLCDLYPYWNHGNGTPIWTTCQGDQYFYPPRVIQADCPNQNPLSDGCWVTNTPGVKHDSYFTDEARIFFVYDSTAGFTLQFFGYDDLFVYINGILVLDLGGVHQQLPGKVAVTGAPGAQQATITEGGCLDAAGNIATTQVSYAAAGCAPAGAPAPISPDDYRARYVNLNLENGKVYELAIFGADRHPPESNYQLTLSGFTTKVSDCIPHCGDGIVAANEECDCGDGTVPVPAGCPGPNNDTTYGGCTTLCRFGPFCGDGVVNGPEQCDQGWRNGSGLTNNDCTFGCTAPHYCGDGNVDTNQGEECDLGALNGVKLDTDGNPSGAGVVDCAADCRIPGG